MKRYSQNDEQDFILKFFEGKKDGHFLDIGAGDGFNDSNTRALWELGWSGVFVEPNQVAFAQLLQVYGSGERAMLIHAAITQQNGPVTFYEHPITGWSSLAPCLGEKKDYRSKTVMGLTLDTLNLPWNIDFLSVDAEGKDTEIIGSMPEWLRPRLIMAEHDKSVGTAWGIGMILVKWGYQEAWHNNANVAYEQKGS